MAQRREQQNTKQSIWDNPKIRKLLKEPVGAPAKLTRAEALAIAEAAFGARRDLPPGSRYVKNLKAIWRGLARDHRAKRSA